MKKQWYWSILAPGKLIAEQFTGKVLGYIVEISGAFDDITYNTWCMKEPDYMMSLVANGGALSKEGNQDVNQIWMDGRHEH